MNWDGRIRADARHLPLADESVQCVVTSPPYWGLRDYGNTGQIGLEKSPVEYVASLLLVFREVWRVLKPDGVLWLNLGDSYAGSWGAQSRDREGDMQGREVIAQRQIARAARKNSRTGSVAHLDGIKAKDLIGVPWTVAFSLRSAGWYLRRDIIWSKPNPMPESVTDRPTTSHEYIFLLTKSAQYFYDAEVIREPDSGQQHHRNVTSGAPSLEPSGGLRNPHTSLWGTPERNGMGRNKRSVWTVATNPYTEAHYATFPPKLIEPCILAGSRPGDLILDPFFGSGTVGMVAEKHGRRWIGCDLSYQDLQEKRLRNVQKVLTL